MSISPLLSKLAGGESLSWHPFRIVEPVCLMTVTLYGLFFRLIAPRALATRLARSTSGSPVHTSWREDKGSSLAVSSAKALVNAFASSEESSVPEGRVRRLLGPKIAPPNICKTASSLVSIGNLFSGEPSLKFVMNNIVS